MHYSAYPVFLPIVESSLRVYVAVLKARAKLLQKYLCDEQKELQALYALQALVVTLDQPPSKNQATGMVRVGGLEELLDCRGQWWKGSQLKKSEWPLESKIFSWLSPFLSNTVSLLTSGRS